MPLAPDDHPEAYVRNKAMSERALFRLHQTYRVSGGDPAPAVHLWARESVLPRGVLLGSAARRTGRSSCPATAIA